MTDRDVRHDAASLYRFVDSVCQSCENRGQHPAYLEANKLFISYVLGLGKATKAYLVTFPDKLSQTPETDYNSVRQELLSLRMSWFDLHRRIKPASDADTLHLPFPLIRALVHRFREITAFNSARFVVIHIEPLNYLQVSASSVQQTANNIARIVGFQPYDKTLGMIGIPYSQSGSLFVNCLIAHEFAHYAYTEAKIASKLGQPSRAALQAAFSTATGLDPKKAQLFFNVLVGWAEELFCDLFAVTLLGPSFSYAYIEIFDLANNLSSGGGFYEPAAREDARFSPSHPAHIFRLKQHVALLEKLGWWTEMSVSTNHYGRLLALAKIFPDAKFKVPDCPPQFEAHLLDALYRLLPTIFQVVNETAQIDSGLQEYQNFRKTLDKYFVLGIVPSSLRDDGGSMSCPKPVTILNSAYTFYLEKLDALIAGVGTDDPMGVQHRGIKDQDAMSVKDREKWAKRIEMWAMKAIDDYLLLNKVKGV